MPDPVVARRWYVLGTVLSVLAVVFAGISHVAPRVGYPTAFVLTMTGLMAVTCGAWPRGRLRLVLVNVGVLASQLLILSSSTG